MRLMRKFVMMKQILTQLQKNNSFLLLCHMSPDGDTLGSAAALSIALKSMGKKTLCAVDGIIPSKLGFLLCDTDFVTEPEKITETFDCAIAIDTATFARLGKFGEIYRTTPSSLNIDHHLTNERYGDFSYIDNRAATGEIVLDLLEHMNCTITVPIANALYAAISTDTNNFVYSNTTEQTFQAAAKLKKAGAETAKLCDRIYYKRSLGATRLIAKALETLHIYENGRLAVLHMTLPVIAECGANRTDCDVLVNYAREIEGVEVGIFINEMPDGKFKVSLRSNAYVDVAAFAAEYGGGGHIRAAGCVYTGTPEEIESEFVKKAKKYLT